MSEICEIKYAKLSLSTELGREDDTKDEYVVSVGDWKQQKNITSIVNFDKQFYDKVKSSLPSP